MTIRLTVSIGVEKEEAPVAEIIERRKATYLQRSIGKVKLNDISPLIRIIRNDGIRVLWITREGHLVTLEPRPDDQRRGQREKRRISDMVHVVVRPYNTINRLERDIGLTEIIGHVFLDGELSIDRCDLVED
jgi:hypothetical protein